MKHLLAALAGFGACGLLVFSLSNSPSKASAENPAEPTPTPVVAGTGQPYYPAIKLPKHLTFAGEQVPLMDDDVRERMDRELLVNSYWHSQTLQNLKLANRWFPIIETILRQNGVPEDFKYLAVAESNLRNVVSPARATGVWQLLEGTAEGYGLTVNGEIDERYDVERATHAACAYLKEAYERYDGNWTLAAASYNMGMAGVDRELRQQKVESYYDLYLNTETSRYLFRIMAFKLIYQQHERFGFILEQEDYYSPLDYYVVEVNSSITDIAQWAKDQGTTYKAVKLLNPWLRSDRLTVSTGKVYEIKLPRRFPASPEGETPAASPKPIDPAVPQRIEP
jgi:soluble lytic murein transglycosylase-like protein